MRHCETHVPYYQRLFAEHNISSSQIQSLDDFRQLPLLTRQTYQTETQQFVSRSLPPNVQVVGQGGTSGTSGIPVSVLRTNITRLWWHAHFLRDLHWCGLNPTKKLAAIRPLTSTLEPQHFATWFAGLEEIVECGHSYVLSAQVDPKQQLSWLQELQTDYLLSIPSNLAFLAAHSLEQDLEWPNLSTIQAISETLLPVVQQRIERAFGALVKNTYSCEEIGYLASPCPVGSGQHVYAENVYLEILNDDHQPCAPGESGRVVMTALHNFATPLIRYDIGDRATPAESCPCGRGLPLLQEVSGKERPLFLLHDGRRKDSQDLAEAFLELEGFYQFQIIQKTVDEIEVHLAIKPNYSDREKRAIIDTVQQYLESPVNCAIHSTQRLQTSPSGKLQSLRVEV